MMAIRDIEKGNLFKGLRESGCIGNFPKRVDHAVRSREMIERFLFLADFRNNGVDRTESTVGQENRTRLSAHRQEMFGPIIFLVLAGFLVFADELPIILVDRVGAGDSRLLLLAPPEPIDVEAGLCLSQKRTLADQAL